MYTPEEIWYADPKVERKQLQTEYTIKKAAPYIENAIAVFEQKLKNFDYEKKSDKIVVHMNCFKNKAYSKSVAKVFIPLFTHEITSKMKDWDIHMKFYNWNRRRSIMLAKLIVIPIALPFAIAYIFMTELRVGITLTPKKFVRL